MKIAYSFTFALSGIFVTCMSFIFTNCIVEIKVVGISGSGFAEQDSRPTSRQTDSVCLCTRLGIQTKI